MKIVSWPKSFSNNLLKIEENLNTHQQSLNWLESNTVTRDDFDQLHSILNYTIKMLQEIRGEKVWLVNNQKNFAYKNLKQK